MSQQRMSPIERLLHRIEDHVEEWRKQDRVHKGEARANREMLWAEASRREKLLAEAIAEEESQQGSIEEKQHRIVFVVHSEEMTQTLETLARERGCLVNVVPGRGNYGGDIGVKGSWLVFEAPE